jgi:hypothetical protein
MFEQFFVLVQPVFFQGLSLVFRSAFVWLPLLLIYVAIQLWLYFIRARYLDSLEWTLLEIKIPKIISKTPQAMEVVLTALHQPRDDDNLLIGSWLKGQVRGWFSLELASIGGDIHFYIRTQKFFRNLVEASLYAQYPEISVSEVEDYTNNVPYDLPGSDWKVWGAEMALTKDDPYPIKTYVHYGLDKAQKEEEKTDPITATLEFLSSIGPGEQIWIQILIMATKDRYNKKGAWFAKQGWKDEGKALIEKLMQRDKKKDDAAKADINILSPGERRVVEEVERSISKLGFDCGIRGLYLAKGDLFKPVNIVGILGAFKQYNSQDLNGFKPGSTTGVKYPWQDPTGRVVAEKKAAMFDAYRRRMYFYPPYVRKPFVLNTEELATIYHFPGQVAQTPTLGKIESKRAEAPVNLPI